MAEEHVDLPSPPLHVYGISTPQTATIHFDKIFKNVEEQTSITFKKISESRNEVVIASERSFAEAAVKVGSVIKFNFNFFLRIYIFIVGCSKILAMLIWTGMLYYYILSVLFSNFSFFRFRWKLLTNYRQISPRTYVRC